MVWKGRHAQLEVRLLEWIVRGVFPVIVVGPYGVMGAVKFRLCLVILIGQRKSGVIRV